MVDFLQEMGIDITAELARPQNHPKGSVPKSKERASKVSSSSDAPAEALDNDDDDDDNDPAANSPKNKPKGTLGSARVREMERLARPHTTHDKYKPEKGDRASAAGAYDAAAAAAGPSGVGGAPSSTSSAAPSSSSSSNPPPSFDVPLSYRTRAEKEATATRSRLAKARAALGIDGGSSGVYRTSFGAVPPPPVVPTGNPISSPSKNPFSNLRGEWGAAAGAPDLPSGARTDKRQAPTPPPPAAGPTPKPQDPLEAALQKFKERAAREAVMLERDAKRMRDYESRWDSFTADGCESRGPTGVGGGARPLKLEDIPWLPVLELLGPNGSECWRVVGCDEHSDVADKKAALRAATMRWHPDKFFAKYGARIGKGGQVDGEAMLEQVKGVTQRLNELRARLAREEGGAKKEDS